MLTVSPSAVKSTFSSLPTTPTNASPVWTPAPTIRPFFAEAVALHRREDRAARRDGPAAWFSPVITGMNRAMTPSPRNLSTIPPFRRSRSRPTGSSPGSGSGTRTRRSAPRGGRATDIGEDHADLQLRAARVLRQLARSRPCTAAGCRASVRARSSRATAPPTPWNGDAQTLQRGAAGRWRHIRRTLRSDGSSPVSNLRHWAVVGSSAGVIGPGVPSASRWAAGSTSWSPLRVVDLRVVDE